MYFDIFPDFPITCPSYYCLEQLSVLTSLRKINNLETLSTRQEKKKQFFLVLFLILLLNFSKLLDLNPYVGSITKPAVIHEEWSLFLITKINIWILSKACGYLDALTNIISPHMCIQMFNIQIPEFKISGYKSLSSPDTTLRKYDSIVVARQIYMDK